MNAVVMCGGLGSRMLPLSEKTPKPMLRVMNRPVLDYLLKKLARDGFTDIYLTLGYRAEEIASYVENRDYGVNVVCRREEKPLGTAGGVKNALKDAPGDFLVISGDNLIETATNSIRKVTRNMKAEQAADQLKSAQGAEASAKSAVNLTKGGAEA